MSSKKKPKPGTPEFLTVVRQDLEYLPMEGELRRRKDGSRADVDKDGEWNLVRVAGYSFWPDSIAWLIQTGDWVAEDVRFRNGIDTDLRWSNLFQLRNDVQVTVIRSGDLFVLMNGGEQVMVVEDLERVMEVAKDILQPGTTAMSKHDERCHK